jgi:predicted RND superfamily exporter protein
VNDLENDRRNAAIAIGLLVAAVLGAIPGLLRLQVERDVTLAFLPKTGAVGENYATYLELFPGDIGTLVVATGDLCTPARWRALMELSEDLAALSVVDKVTGLPTAEYVVGVGDRVEVKNFVDLRPEPEAELCSLASGYPPYRSLLLSDDLRAMTLYVRAFKDLDAVTINRDIEPVVRRHRPSFLDDHGGDLFQAGSTYLAAEGSRLTVRSGLLVGAVAIIMLLTTGYMTGLLRAGVLAILCGLVGVAWTFALMGYLGIKQNPTNSLVAQVLIPLGAAFTIHACGHAASRGSWKLGLIPEGAIRPFAFAVVTTMVGFGATAISTIPNIRHFGLLGIFGIGICAAMTVGFTFPLLRRRGPTGKEVPQTLPSALGLSFRMNRTQTVVLVGALGVLSIAGLLRVRVNYGPLDYLPLDNQVRIDMDRGAESFSRISQQMLISGTEPDSAIDPELWKEVRTFIQKTETKHPGVRASWIYDQVSELSKAFTADEATPTELPDSKDLIAQYLLLLDPREVEPFLDWDRSHMTVMFRVPWTRSAQFPPFKRDLEEFSRETGIDAVLTGQVSAVFQVIDRMAVENVQSLAIGLVGVLLLLWMLARAPEVAVIATLVNAGPVLAGLAFLGFMSIDLDLGSSIVSAIALGIVVDDTGHLIARYTQHRRDGRTPEAGARLMLLEFWKPVLTTSVVIVVGFSVMNLAELAPFHTFSRVLSVAVIFAAFGDLVLLPALLIHFDRTRPGDK